MNPASDIETISIELILADLQTVDKALPRLDKESRKDKSLVAQFEEAKKAKEALEAGTGVLNAELDLEARREGDVLGASQSGGRSGLRFLRLARDEELIVTAHEAAWATVEADPDLTGSPALRRELDLLDAERAAYLERG